MNNEQKRRRRIQERIPCNLELEINDSIVCNAFDIGEGGMYVLTDQSFKPGHVIKISLVFRNEKIEIRSKVKYCHEGVGIGVMFIDLDDAIKNKIKKLVTNIKQST